jgi:hypothetical protein
MLGLARSMMRFLTLLTAIPERYFRVTFYATSSGAFFAKTVLVTN